MNENLAIDYDDSCFTPNHKKIAELNDNFRKIFSGGRVVLSSGVDALDLNSKIKIIKKVQNFSDFDFKNDPYGEHDFGVVYEGNEQIFWKIDYYDETMTYASEDPSDEKVTNRVLTIYLASEH